MEEKVILEPLLPFPAGNEPADIDKDAPAFPYGKKEPAE
jgi:hypothetical protein